MGKKNSKDTHSEKYNFRNKNEVTFINNIYEACNYGYIDLEIDRQITAIKRVINYIKYRKEAGATLEELNDEVLKYIYQLASQISSPDLISFYRMRTFEYLDGLNLTPYIEAIVNEKIDIKEYAKIHKNDYCSNLESNIRVEICELLSELEFVLEYSTNEEVKYICQRIKDNDLEIADIPMLTKYLKYYCRELKIGRFDSWEKMRKNPENLIKMLTKHLNDIFEVENQVAKISATINSDNQSEKLEDKIKKINSQTPNISSVHKGNMTKVKLKGVKGNPFISTDETNNLLIYSNVLFKKISDYTTKSTPDVLLMKMYSILKQYSIEKDEKQKDHLKELISDWFTCIYYGRNELHLNEKLLKRITCLIDFFNANGQLDRFCTVNNSRLQRIKLPELQISAQELYNRFITAEKDKEDLIYLRSYDNGSYFFDRCYKNAPVSGVSQEALIAMSAFYINRLAKEAVAYGRVKYIFDQQNIIEKLYENPNLEYKDLGIDRSTLVLYMSMYDEVQTLITQRFIDNLEDYEDFNEEIWTPAIEKSLSEIKGVYESFFKTHSYNFDYKRDIKNVEYGAVLSRFIYDLKEFSVSSLMYTALTDKNKNILNWGYVPEDENQDSNIILIGFDIKQLNMPVYVHMIKEDVVGFLMETTGEAKLPVYQGADDMYNYNLKKRLTTQIVYPFSKEERKKLLKVTGIIKDDRTYQHLRWLQQPNNPPSAKYLSGTRYYDIQSDKEIKIDKQASNEKSNDKKEGKKRKSAKGNGQQDSADFSNR